MGSRKKRSKERSRGKATSPASREDRHLLNGPPEGSQRTRVRYFIGLFLLVNLLTPLKWYVGQSVGADVDERFCWRMFSSDSMQRCQVEVRETVVDGDQTVERLVPLETIVPPAWAKFLNRYHQPALVKHLLAEHCRQTDALSVSYERSGTWSDGSSFEPYALTIECDQN